MTVNPMDSKRKQCTFSTINKALCHGKNINSLIFSVKWSAKKKKKLSTRLHKVEFHLPALT